ncbi:ABC transporter ATP-binding protein [Flexivirga endophytica]|uniref:ABC transporter ATP-binding protein n=1 Tax=Flexivirga endophytica TaxID=1849103 RepID=A0A916SUD3_9MICO|nr:ABC transporter ATP-binding protein [Flexivirga endophytica]GGB16992.1 ABC transporter ATP-binding protein [Flexivirga endophytica]GHB38561.1 ABC transporter ATP-binding protein [Flexivirga endophytica]
MEEIARFTDVTRTFRGTVAVDSVDLILRPGEIVALLGPNGAGKSTLLDMLLGLRDPSAGTVRAFGMPPTARRARARMGAMLQDTTGPVGLTVAETVQLTQHLYPQATPLAELLALVELSDKAGRRVGELSGGERQRLSLALALTGSPDLLVLDEPTAALDVAGRRRLLRTIRDLAAQDRAIVLATHDLREAQEVADRVVVLHHGRKIADASTQEIVRRVGVSRMQLTTDAPAAWVANFLGVTEVSSSSDGRLELLTADAEGLLGALFSAGHQVRDLTVADADLESAFLTLTQEPAA